MDQYNSDRPRSRMDNRTVLLWLNRAGWLFFALAVANFLGLLTHYDTAMEAKADVERKMMGLILPDIDVKTILLAGVAALLGWNARKLGKKMGQTKPKGTAVMICAAVCAALTFTDLGIVSLIRPAIIAATRPAGYEDVSPENFELYVFLGSDKSNPSDEDVMNYKGGYDGHARETYKKYKICGYIKNVSQNASSDLVLTFVLLDGEGNEVLDQTGQPCILTTKELSYLPIDGFEELETNVVQGKKLSAPPVRFRVVSARQAVYLK